MVMQRFWDKVDKTDTCWLWTGAIDGHGYGAFKFGGKRVFAHRFSYEQLVGPIPDGLDLDHVKARGCVNRHCVNPAHLEPVTRQTNLLRGARKTGITHCPQGHEYAGSNLYVYPDGRRECRTCHNEASMRYRERNLTGVV